MTAQDASTTDCLTAPRNHRAGSAQRHFYKAACVFYSRSIIPLTFGGNNRWQNISKTAMIHFLHNITITSLSKRPHSVLIVPDNIEMLFL